MCSSMKAQRRCCRSRTFCENSKFTLLSWQLAAVQSAKCSKVPGDQVGSCVQGKQAQPIVPNLDDRERCVVQNTCQLHDTLVGDVERQPGPYRDRSRGSDYRDIFVALGSLYFLETACHSVAKLFPAFPGVRMLAPDPRVHNGRVAWHPSAVYGCGMVAIIRANLLPHVLVLPLEFPVSSEQGRSNFSIHAIEVKFVPAWVRDNFWKALSIGGTQLERRVLLAAQIAAITCGETNFLRPEILAKKLALAAAQVGEGIVRVAGAGLAMAHEVQVAHACLSASAAACLARPLTRWSKSRKRSSLVWPREKR